MSTTLLGSTMPRRLVAVLTAAMFGLTLAVNPSSAPEANAVVSGFHIASRPVSARVSSEFGWRYHPILHRWRFHSGIDFAARCGAPVRAAVGGTVVFAGRAGGYGNRIVVNDGIRRRVSLSTTYSHLSRFLVRRGRHVSRGQIIARVGTTGFSTGCHLHFETLQNGRPVNPRRWF